jgi:RimJ/RimL family protein N-acetyltransferase
MSHHRPKRYDGILGRDLVLATCILAATSVISVAIGFTLHESQLDAWGSWLGAFIAGIALVASGYAIVVQARHGESTSWNIALGRLGELYDNAFADPRLARMLTEAPDPSGAKPLTLADIDLTIQERVWLGSLFLAFEQIYVATMALSSESRRVWRLYLRNQLNKPTIRAVFVSDAGDAKDFHAKFYEFVRGRKSKSKPGVYEDWAIDPKFFGDLASPSDNSPHSHTEPLVALPFAVSDAGFWLEIYRDEEVKKQMYAAPTDSVDSLISYLSARKVFTVWMQDKRVGGFTITPEKDRMATFGIVVDSQHRGRGLSSEIMVLMEKEARQLGALTLRGDVYADNTPSIRALENAGFRKFLWYEKNIG